MERVDYGAEQLARDDDDQNDHREKRVLYSKGICVLSSGPRLTWT